MYLDTVVIAGVITVAAVVLMMGYSGYYAYKHFVKDAKEHPGE